MATCWETNWLEPQLKSERCKSMNRDTAIAKFAKDASDFARDYINAMKPHILLLGPDTNGIGEGARLRKELSKRCWALATTVFTEHSEIEKAARKHTSTASNLTRWEILVAKRSQVIIIIPDSPGSFAELGAFAQLRDICPRMLILFDKQYKKDGSYIQRGPKKAAEERRAVIWFVDYSEIDKIWKKVSNFIMMEKGRMAELD